MDDNKLGITLSKEEEAQLWAKLKSVHSEIISWNLGLSEMDIKALFVSYIGLETVIHREVKSNIEYELKMSGKISSYKRTSLRPDRVLESDINTENIIDGIKKTATYESIYIDDMCEGYLYDVDFLSKLADLNEKHGELKAKQRKSPASFTAMILNSLKRKSINRAFKNRIVDRVSLGYTKMEKSNWPSYIEMVNAKKTNKSRGITQSEIISTLIDNIYLLAQKMNREKEAKIFVVSLIERLEDSRKQNINDKIELKLGSDSSIPLSTLINELSKYYGEIEADYRIYSKKESSYDNKSINILKDKYGSPKIWEELFDSIVEYAKELGIEPEVRLKMNEYREKNKQGNITSKDKEELTRYFSYLKNEFEKRKKVETENEELNELKSQAMGSN